VTTLGPCPEALPQSSCHLPVRPRPGADHRQRRQRLGRHLHVFAAGAKYGYLPLWTLIPITLLLIVTQEMCSRMGAVTGKGLSDLIREEFGLRTTFFMMARWCFANWTNVMPNSPASRVRSSCSTSAATSRSR
jgi:hypothetical protein